MSYVSWTRCLMDIFNKTKCLLTFKSSFPWLRWPKRLSNHGIHITLSSVVAGGILRFLITDIWTSFTRYPVNSNIDNNINGFDRCNYDLQSIDLQTQKLSRLAWQNQHESLNSKSRSQRQNVRNYNRKRDLTQENSSAGIEDGKCCISRNMADLQELRVDPCWQPTMKQAPWSYSC